MNDILLKMNPPAKFGIGRMNDPILCPYCNGPKNNALIYDYESPTGIVYKLQCKYFFHEKIDKIEHK